MSKINAADAIRASIRQNKALMDYADELEKIGSIEQAAEEAKAANAKARQQLDFTNELVVKAKGELEAVEAQIKAKSAEHQNLAQDVLQKAQTDAQSIRENAKNRAGRIINDAESKSKTVTESASTELAKLNEALAEANKSAKAAITKKTKAEAELAEIQDKIAEVFK